METMQNNHERTEPVHEPERASDHAERDRALSEIARSWLFLDTLETRHGDDLDFSDQAVWSLRDALREAYEAGRAAGADRGKRGEHDGTHPPTQGGPPSRLDGGQREAPAAPSAQRPTRRAPGHAVALSPATSAERWELYDQVEGAEDAASRLEAALADASRTARQMYAEADEDLVDVAARVYRRTVAPALQRESKHGGTDAEPRHVAITRLASALSPASKVIRQLIEDAICDAG